MSHAIEWGHSAFNRWIFPSRFTSRLDAKSTEVDFTLLSCLPCFLSLSFPVFSVSGPDLRAADADAPLDTGNTVV